MIEIILYPLYPIHLAKLSDKISHNKIKDTEKLDWSFSMIDVQSSLQERV
jgi:hypothetical protein